jgi:hypothetical protein
MCGTPYQLQDSKRWKITILGAAEKSREKTAVKGKSRETRNLSRKTGPFQP